MFHCHIFFHHMLGMMSELVVVKSSDGNERPHVDAALASVSAPEGQPVAMTGTYGDREGDVVTLSASAGALVDNGDNTWSWSQTVSGPPTPVFVTATDAAGNRAQTVFVVAEDNLPPTVTIDHGQVHQIPKGTTLAVLAGFVDQNDDDPYTATIDFGTGLGPQPVVPNLTTTSPPQAGAVAGSFTYDQEGTFTVTVAVTDQNRGAGSASFQVMVVSDELPPTGHGAGLATVATTLVGLGIGAVVVSSRRRGERHAHA